MIGEISSLLFLGLEEIDTKKLSQIELDRIMELLRKENPKKLRHDLRLAPSKVSDFVNKQFLNPIL
jgi:hypothetical protein